MRKTFAPGSPACRPPPLPQCPLHAEAQAALLAEALLTRRLCVADITYIRTGEGWLYLAVALDLFSRKVVGWAMRDHMRAELPLTALTMAIQRQRPAPRLIHHSDRGSQHGSSDNAKLLKSHKITASMSRKGNCWNNAPMESFFGSLKTEMVHGQHFRTRDEALRELFVYIESHYNRVRLHSALGYTTPDQVEREARTTDFHRRFVCAK